MTNFSPSRINNYVTFLLPNLDCFCEGEQMMAGAKYAGEANLAISSQCPPKIIKDLDKIHTSEGEFVFLDFLPIIEQKIFNFKIKGADFMISAGSKILIFKDNIEIFAGEGADIKFFKKQELKDYCLLFFEGDRNFFVSIKAGELDYAAFYDEINFGEGEIYVSTKLRDSLNHGRVYHIGEGGAEKYLVYLDDHEMKLKREFLPAVFLDCVIAKNFKYANALLSESLKGSEQAIADFFGEIIDFYPVSDSLVIINKKGARSAYKFEIEDLKIKNIIEV